MDLHLLLLGLPLLTDSGFTCDCDTDRPHTCTSIIPTKYATRLATAKKTTTKKPTVGMPFEK